MNTSFSSVITSYALSIGFSKAGITTPDLPDIPKQRLSQWLDAGYNANMQWMAKRSTERGDVYAYFPEVKSVISVAMNYFTARASDSPDALKISNYAWGDDYHDMMKQKLFELLAFIRLEYPDCNYRVCVDTSPVQDKVWAQRAGLGWQGKHTNLITTDHGSWLFLGELMLDIELTPDSPFDTDHCGSCTACLDACPTNAFPQPYVLDASKCISYLTIEHRGDIPPEFEGVFNGWIYGCDICQQVCPWNQKFEQVTHQPEFQMREQIRDRSTEQWSELSEDEFRRVFKNSAVKRTKHRGLKRNINFVSKTVGKNQSTE
ncbi:MAG: tRNA epoxyqueuosine(34) reductase QueG [Candidatus Marinimicrobia bacterium]|nr:tRNA epoxyqueuosine(34) reductase QueG [Candidatus Neomarinimicrobiota bacterium]